MRKYLFIFKAELMSTLQYIGNLLFNTIGYFIIIFIFIYLWNYMYDDPSKLINGYTKEQMIWYVIITEILWCIYNGRRFCRRICNDIKSGNITYNMNKPYSYVGYILSSHMGEVVIKTVIYVTIGMVLGRIALGGFPNITIVMALIVLISGLLAVTIDALFIIFISLISLFIEDSYPLYWLYSKMILVLGTMFPIEFFPPFFQKFISLSPIYVICYGPAKLFVDFNVEMAMNIIIAQIIYIGIAFTLCMAIYTKGVKKLNVNGG